MHQDRSDFAEDAELLLKLSEGSKPAFDTLYNKYWKQVYNTAFKRLYDAERAQDVAQDVFVQLWVRGTKSPIENLPAYLMVSARNGVFKLLEKEGKYAQLPDDTANRLEDPLDRADAAVLHEEFMNAFNQLVNSLPNQQRIIFKLRFEDDMSSQQIADLLQISPKTVRNQLGKALSSLRDTLLLMNLLIILYSSK
ncbi:RNA polymerase sigma factor [Pedobacter metabolipauper]|uniref:RNA polymerase sigma-70 factor (ECF subfamily) n=1 Tax=Pedobacter metabolipauper TaxID=425513 RepID=A0A4R6SRQ1_9SPHI|nr:sigma-70 family RNA polymerase sigma factor [Pedobacter metabolipauper]TDQ07122.1 RNA polymerase sigma-70 factor (ECF subfamily) [Pedobacter metabolipauper]